MSKREKAIAWAILSDRTILPSTCAFYRSDCLKSFLDNLHMDRKSMKRHGYSIRKVVIYAL